MRGMFANNNVRWSIEVNFSADCVLGKVKDMRGMFFWCCLKSVSIPNFGDQDANRGIDISNLLTELTDKMSLGNLEAYSLRTTKSPIIPIPAVRFGILETPFDEGPYDYQHERITGTKSLMGWVRTREKEYIKEYKRKDEPGSKIKACHTAFKVMFRILLEKQFNGYIEIEHSLWALHGAIIKIVKSAVPYILKHKSECIRLAVSIIGDPRQIGVKADMLKHSTVYERYNRLVLNDIGELGCCYAQHSTDGTACKPVKQWFQMIQEKRNIGISGACLINIMCGASEGWMNDSDAIRRMILEMMALALDGLPMERRTSEYLYNTDNRYDPAHEDRMSIMLNIWGSDDEEVARRESLHGLLDRITDLYKVIKEIYKIECSTHTEDQLNLVPERTVDHVIAKLKTIRSKIVQYEKKIVPIIRYIDEEVDKYVEDFTQSDDQDINKMIQTSEELIQQRAEANRPSYKEIKQIAERLKAKRCTHCYGEIENGKCKCCGAAYK